MSTETGVALVTGANRGIGLEVSRQLLRLGYTVFVGARDTDKGAHAAAQLRETGVDVRVLELDITVDVTIEDARSVIGDEFGRLDVLVNNAAIGFAPQDVATSTDLVSATAILETNVLGAWRVTQQMLPLIHNSSRGRIVNVSSRGGSFECRPGLHLSGIAAYSVSKAALNALTVKLATELVETGILVNAVCPGHTASAPGATGRPVEEGAAAIVHAATLPDGGPTGRFFGDMELIPW